MMKQSKRRFFSGNTVEQAVIAAACEFDLSPAEVAYRKVEKKHGFLRSRKKVVIEVDPEAPRKAATEAEDSGESAIAAAARLSSGRSGRPKFPAAPGQKRSPSAAATAGAPGADDGGGASELPAPVATGTMVEADVASEGVVDSGREVEAGALEDVTPQGEDPSSAPVEPTHVEEEVSSPTGLEEVSEPVALEEVSEPAERAAASDAISSSASGDGDGAVVGADEEDTRESSSAASRRGEEQYDEEDLTVAEEAVDYLLTLTGLDLEYEVVEDGDRITVYLEGEDADLLLREHGKALFAIEHLLPKVIRGISGDRVFCHVDSMDFRENRRIELEEMALEAADEVRDSGEAKVLDLLNPAERRIVHMTLADDPDVETESEGRGYLKRLTVWPR